MKSMPVKVKMKMYLGKLENSNKSVRLVGETDEFWYLFV